MTGQRDFEPSGGRIFRVTMNVVDTGGSAAGPGELGLHRLLDGLATGELAVLDDAISVTSTTPPGPLPSPDYVRDVLDQLVDGEISIRESDLDGGPVWVEITASGRTFVGSGCSLEVALGAAVQDAIRTGVGPRLVTLDNGGVRPPCPDGSHRWIGPVEYLDGPRLMCLNCLTTDAASSRVSDRT